MRIGLNKRFLAYLLCLCALFYFVIPSMWAFADTGTNNQTANNPFTDVPSGKWFTKAVLFCKDKGYMSGTSKSTFSPSATVTRAMAITVLWRLAGAPKDFLFIPPGYEITDLESGKWYYNPAKWGLMYQIVTGTTNHTFSPNDPVTREQLALMLMKYSQNISGIDTSSRNDLLHFSDAALVNFWAKDAISWAVAEGLISGKGNGILDPRGSATRAEFAQMINKFYYFLRVKTQTN